MTMTLTPPVRSRPRTSLGMGGGPTEPTGGLRLGVTGTSRLADEHLAVVPTTLLAAARLDVVEEVITGCQRGVDAHAARAAYRLWPEVTHRLIVPSAPHDEEVVEWFEEEADCNDEANVVIERLPPAPTDAMAYHARNDAVLDRSTRLAAIALHEEDRMPRSGTWWTVRRARERGIELELVVLEPRVTA